MKKITLFLMLTFSFGANDTTSISMTINDNTIDWANLQHPESGTIDVGTSYQVYAQIYESGVTNGTGQGSGIAAWIGHSATNTDPSGDGWTWVSASYNSDSGNNDEYIAEIGTGITTIGTYYYASRFSIDGGVTYAYGGHSSGGGGGFWDGSTYVSGTLTITGNTAPILASIGDQTMTEDVVMTLTLSATDADNDNLSYSVSGGSSSTVSGSVSGTTLTLTSASNYNTSTAITFTLTVSDGNGGTDSDTFDVTVTGVNDAPVIASLEDQTGSEGTEFTFTLTATDVDGDALTWSSVNLPTGSALTDNSDGTASFNWTPDYTQAGTYANIQFIVSDGQGAAVVAQVNTNQISRR